MPLINVRDNIWAEVHEGMTGDKLFADAERQFPGMLGSTAKGNTGPGFHGAVADYMAGGGFFGATVTGMAEGLEDAGLRPLKMLKGDTKGIKRDALAQRLLDEQTRIEEAKRGTGEKASHLLDLWQGAARSALPQMAAMPLGVGAPVMYGIGGASQASSAFADALADGATTGQAAAYGGAQGALEMGIAAGMGSVMGAGFEGLGTVMKHAGASRTASALGGIADDAAPLLDLKDLGKLLVKSNIREIPEELATSLAQMGPDALLSKELTGEYLPEGQTLGDMLSQGAVDTTLATLMQGGMMHAPLAGVAAKNQITIPKEQRDAIRAKYKTLRDAKRQTAPEGDSPSGRLDGLTEDELKQVVAATGDQEASKKLREGQGAAPVVTEDTPENSDPAPSLDDIEAATVQAFLAFGHANPDVTRTAQEDGSDALAVNLPNGRGLLVRMESANADLLARTEDGSLVNEGAVRSFIDSVLSRDGLSRAEVKARTEQLLENSEELQTLLEGNAAGASYQDQRMSITDNDGRVLDVQGAINALGDDGTLVPSELQEEVHHFLYYNLFTDSERALFGSPETAYQRLKETKPLANGTFLERMAFRIQDWLLKLKEGLTGTLSDTNREGLLHRETQRGEVLARPAGKIGVQKGAAAPKTAPKEQQPVEPPAPTGPSFEAVTPQGDVKVKGQWRVMDMEDILASEDQGFDSSLQPRERKAQASREQIAQMAVSLDPTRLAESPSTDTGSPMVNADGHVISGNGRVLAIRMAYESDKAKGYTEAVSKKAQELGLSTEGMTRPVLVREIQDTSGKEMQEVAELSNRSAILQRNPVEQAEADAKSIAPFVHEFTPDATGRIRAGSNMKFLERFIQATGDQSLRSSDGSFLPDIDNRVRRAVLAGVLEGLPQKREVLRKGIEEAEALGMKSAIDGVMSEGGNLLKLADLKPELDLRPALGKALVKLSEYKTEKADGTVKSLDQYLGQADMFAEDADPLVGMLLRELDGRSAKGVRDLIGDYLAYAENVDTQTGSLFGDEVGSTTPLELMQQATGDVTYSARKRTARRLELARRVEKSAKKQKTRTQARKAVVRLEKQLREKPKDVRFATRRVTNEDAAKADDEAAMLEILDGTNNVGERVRVAQDPNATEAVLLKAVKDTDRVVRMNAYKHSNATEAMLLRAMEDSDYQLRYDAVKHKHATEAVLLKGIKDSNESIRRAAVQNSNTTEAILFKVLNMDRFSAPHLAVVQHRNATEAILLKGLKDPDDDVRRGAAASPNATERVLLEALEEKRHSSVRMEAAANPNATESVLRKAMLDNYEYTRQAVARNKNTPESILLNIMENHETQLRVMAAVNQNATEAVLAKAIQDKSHMVRMVAAAHKNATEEILSQAVKDEDEEIRAAAVENKNMKVSSILDATTPAVQRFRREILTVADKAKDAADYRAAVRAVGNKQEVENVVQRALGKEVLGKWKQKNEWHSDVLEEAAKSDSGLYALPPTRRESSIQTFGGFDNALSYFYSPLQETDSELVDALSKVGVASGHPAGFGFVLYRPFYKPDGTKVAVITEVQSDTMSVLYSKDKEDLARERIGEERLEAAREAVAPIKKTWPKMLYRDAYRRLREDEGIERVYILTPAGQEELGASPPSSVVAEVFHEKAARAEGFGPETIVGIENENVEVWDAPDREADEQLRFSTRKLPTEPVRPELANPITDEQARPVADEVDRQREEQGEPETRPLDDVIQVAEKRLGDDYDSERQRVIDTVNKGEALSADDTEVLRAIFDKEASHAVGSGDTKQLRAALAVGDAYRRSGTEWGRVGVVRRDRVLTPEARGAVVAQVAMRPTKKTQKELDNNAEAIKGAFTPAQVRALLKKRDNIIEKLRQEIAKLKRQLDRQGVELKPEMTPDEAVTAIREVAAAKSDGWDALYEYWINSILSGPTTHAVNIVSNTAFATWELGVVKLVEAVGNTVTRKEQGAQLGEFKHMLTGMGPGIFGRAFRNAAQAFHEERPVLLDELRPGSDTSSALEAHANHFALSGKKGRVARIPGRSLLFMDEVAKSIIVEMQVGAYAYRQAKAEGLTGRELTNRVAEIIADRSSKAWDNAIEDAIRGTFQKEGVVSRTLGGVRQKVPGLRYVIPFVRTPVNILGFGLRLTIPGALVSWKKSMGTRNVTREAANTALSFAIAWGLAEALGLLGGEDDDEPFITGSVPYTMTSKGERDHAYRHAPPQSVKLGDTWYSYARVEPFATVLAATVDALNGVVRAKKGEDSMDVATDAVTGFLTQLKDKSYLRGMGDVLKAMEDPYDTQRWAANFATSWIPNIAKQTARASDPMVREIATGSQQARLMDRVKYQALPTGKDVPAKVNIWGREVKKGTSPVPGTDFLYRLLSPSRSTDEQEGLPADLDRMLTIWNANHPGAEYWPERPRPYFQHRGERYYFSADQYTAYLKASGERALEVLGKRKLNFDEPTDRDIERVRQALGDARARAARGAKREVIRDNASSR